MKIKWFSFIRVAGLLLVLIYHFYQESLPGGFIGVDLFFTFSGYLITALAVDEFAKSNRFRLKTFYRKRLFRIFPPLLLMVFITLILVFFTSRDYIVDIFHQVTSALSFTTNFWEIKSGGSYESRFIPHLFVHTWSLALEFQFYLVWGFILFVIGKAVRAKSSREKAVTKFQSIIFFLSIILAISSLVLMWIKLALGEDVSNIYFSSAAHAFPFFIGSTVGTLAGIDYQTRKFQYARETKWNINKIVIILFISFGLLFIFARKLTFDNPLTYIFGFLFASLLTVSLIYCANILHHKTPQVKEPWIILFLAEISYGLYLFHWPLYIIFSSQMNHMSAIIWTLVLSIIFSSFSYYFIEPLFYKGKSNLWHKTVTLKQVLFPLFASIVLFMGLFFYYQSVDPGISSLEEDLWIANVYQDIDKLENMRQQMGNQKATKYNIPEGVTIIGDSVTLGCRNYLSEHIEKSYIDAELNRTIDLAYSVMIDLQDKNQLREYVVICIGTNPVYDYEEQTERLIAGLGKGHKLIFITPYDGSRDASELSKQIADYERTLPKKYAFVTVGEWDVAARNHPEIFIGTDGTHFAGIEAGNELYLQVIEEALKIAQERPEKN